MKIIIIILVILSNKVYCQVNHYLYPKNEICLIGFDKNEFVKNFNHVKIDSSFLFDIKKIEKIELLKLCKHKNSDSLKEAGDLPGFKISIIYYNNKTAIDELIKILKAFKKTEFITKNKLFTFFKPGLYISRTNKTIEIYRLNSGVFNEKKLHTNFKLNNLKFNEGYYVSHNVCFKFSGRGMKIKKTLK